MSSITIEDRDRNFRPQAESISQGQLRQLSEQLLVKLIENEINAAFIFVSAARNGYRAAKFSEANAALSKAEAIHAQAVELARDSCAENDAHIKDRLRQLRTEIDNLMKADGDR